MAEMVQIYSTINIYADGDSAIQRSPSAGSVPPGTYYKYGQAYVDGYMGNPNVFPISNTNGGSIRGWINIAEDLRPTVPQITPTNVVMGNTITINLPRQRTSITHSVKWTFGTLSGNIGSNIGTSTSWTPSTSLASEIPDREGMLAYIDVTSYESGREIGTRRGQVSIYVPSSYVPSGTRSLTDAGGLPTAFSGRYVQGRSKLRVSITSASGVAGSTIRSISTKVGEATYTHSGTDAITVDLLNAGTIPVVTTFTDTRGKTHSISQSIVVHAYEPPKIEQFWGVRSLSSGTIHELGNYLHARVKYTISPVNIANSGTWKVESRPVGSTTWTQLMSGSSPANVDTTRTSTSGILDTTITYEVRLTVEDKLSAPRVLMVLVQASGAVISIYRDFKGIAFGKSATVPEVVDSVWPIIAPDITLVGGSVEDRLDGVWNDSSTEWQDGTQGYFRFPTGHMMVYGYTYIAPSTSYVDVVFARAFDTRLANITGNFHISNINPDDYTASNWASWTVTVMNPSKTGARLIVRAGDDNKPPAGGGYIYWQAFGY